MLTPFKTSMRSLPACEVLVNIAYFEQELLNS
jgi:hypothetical protein